MDIASVNSAMRISVVDNTIVEVYASAGGVGPIPLFLAQTCEFLKGKELSTATIISSFDVLQSEITPISDARGTKEYKSLALRQLFYAHFMELFPGIFKMEALV